MERFLIAALQAQVDALSLQVAWLVTFCPLQGHTNFSNPDASGLAACV